ncbi:MAG TPA: AMP-binding protein [Dehalococcoidia bacterium]|nr:AMP-binding protein [Dehalococcoidia bacterium]
MVIGIRRPRSPEENGHIPSTARPRTIPGLLADAAHRWADRPAYRQKIRREWRRLTFREVHQRARAFAAGLAALGLRKGDRVAIVMENGLDWVIAYLGQSIAGGIGVPIYYDLKADEIDREMRHAECRFLICSTKVLDRIGDQHGLQKIVVVGEQVVERPGRGGLLFRPARPDVVPFSQVESLATDESRRAIESLDIQPDDLASIVFTSGTTGGAKGVMLTHGNFTANVDSARRSIGVDERDRVLLVLPMHHAFPFLVGLLGPIGFGGEVAFENDLLRVRDRMLEVRPTLFLGVPALFDVMYKGILQRLEAEGRLELFQRGLRIVDRVKERTGVNIGKVVFRELHQRLGGQLRFMISGGAALDPELQRNFFRLGLPLLQGWGLTEAAPVLAVQRWNPRKFYMTNYYEERIGSVGQPVEDVEIALIDVPEKELYVHLHGQGELIARGPNIFPGYWKAPEETRAAKLGEWLRTGDVGRIDSEGNIYITGRSKFVIVLDSGEKVHPDEVEEQVGRHPLVQDICVVGRRIRDKTVVSAVIYPNVEETKRTLEERGLKATEENIRALVTAAVNERCAALAQYKRIADIQLSDQPLPKTVLRKIARGSIKERYSFDVATWETSAPEEAVPAAASAEPEEEP